MPSLFLWCQYPSPFSGPNQKPWNHYWFPSLLFIITTASLSPVDSAFLISLSIFPSTLVPGCLFKLSICFHSVLILHTTVKWSFPNTHPIMSLHCLLMVLKIKSRILYILHKTLHIWNPIYLPCLISCSHLTSCWATFSSGSSGPLYHL